jgi:hypothetical protein
MVAERPEERRPTRTPALLLLKSRRLMRVDIASALPRSHAAKKPTLHLLLEPQEQGGGRATCGLIIRRGMAGIHAWICVDRALATAPPGRARPLESVQTYRRRFSRGLRKAPKWIVLKLEVESQAERTLESRSRPSLSLSAAVIGVTNRCAKCSIVEEYG